MFDVFIFGEQQQVDKMKTLVMTEMTTIDILKVKPDLPDEYIYTSFNY